MAIIFSGDGQDYVDRLIVACQLPKQQQQPLKERTLEVCPSSWIGEAAAPTGKQQPRPRKASPVKQTSPAMATVSFSVNQVAHPMRPLNIPVGAPSVCPGFFSPPKPDMLPTPSQNLLCLATLVKA